MLRGVLYNGSNFISVAQTDADIDLAIEAYAASLERLSRASPTAWTRCSRANPCWPPSARWHESLLPALL